MRQKGKYKKDKKILIRVDKTEKALAEKLSKAEGMNTSQFFRGLLHDAQQNISIQDVIETTIKKEMRRKK